VSHFEKKQYTSTFHFFADACSPMKRPRTESGSENDTDGESEMDAMECQPTQHITATLAIGDVVDELPTINPTMTPPLSPEHAAIRADFEIITATAMEQLYL